MSGKQWMQKVGMLVVIALMVLCPRAVWAESEQSPTGIEIVEEGLEFETKTSQAQQLTAELIPAEALGEIVWSSSEEKIATVDQNGLVTPTGYGYCDITAEVSGTELKASCRVAVFPHNLEVAIDGETVANITGKWMLDNISNNAQLFSYTKGKNSPFTTQYGVAQGVPFEEILKEATVITDNITELEDCKFIFYDKNGPVNNANAESGQAPPLLYSQLVNGVYAYDGNPGDRLTDENGQPLIVTPSMAIYYQSYSKLVDAQSAFEAIVQNPKSIYALENKTTYMFFGGQTDEEITIVSSPNVTANKQVTGTVKIDVITPDPDCVQLDKTTLTFNTKEAQTLTAEVLPQAVVNKAVVWSSTNEQVATVEDGVVTPVGGGTCKIIATSAANSQVSAACDVTVIKVPASVRLNKSSLTFNKKENQILTAEVLPPDAGDKGVVWSSSNEKVATVKNGVVTPVAAGTCNVTVTSTANNQLKAECKVMVNFPGTPTLSSVKAAGYNSVKLTWQKVNDAAGYIVYQATSKNGTYSQITTITNANTVSYQKTGLKTGKTYYYKVMAYRNADGKQVLSLASSNIVSAKPVLGKVTLASVKNVKTKSEKVTWKKVSGASGYVVYRATKKNGSYKTVKTIKKGSTVSYTDKKLGKGKTYYYKVRAYRTVDGKKVYSEYSIKKGAKIVK